MTTPIALEPGEKVVWQSRGGGPAGWPQWVYVVAVLVGLHLCGSVMFVPIALVGSSRYDRYDEAAISAREPTIAEALLGALPSVFCTLVSFGLAGAAGYVAIRPRLAPSYFLTPRRLVATRLFGGYDTWALTDVRELRQYVAVYHGRYGERREIATHRVQLQLPSGGWVTFGPVADLSGLLDLYEHAIGTSWVELAALPEVGGAPAPAETRDDVLFVATTRTDGMTYGPLFVGPSRLVRFTEVPEAHQLGRLYTLLARPGTAEEAEELVLTTARAGSMGHFVDIARDDARPTIDGALLSVRIGERLEPISLREPDAARARRFLARRG